MSGIPFICGHCARPILTGGVTAGGTAFHLECTRSPLHRAPQLSEADVRRIVQDELVKSGLLTKPSID